MSASGYEPSAAEVALRAAIAPRIKRLREEAEANQDDVAKAIGVTQPALSNYENGRRTPPLLTIVNLARYFGVGVDELVRVA